MIIIDKEDKEDNELRFKEEEQKTLTIMNRVILVFAFVLQEMSRITLLSM